MWKLFLDDERYPSDVYSNIQTHEWTIARNYHDAVWYVHKYGLPSFISFDHDLGSPQNLTGMDFAKWFCNHVMDQNISLEKTGFMFYVHSQNPVGAENIRSYMTQFIKNY